MSPLIAPESRVLSRIFRLREKFRVAENHEFTRGHKRECLYTDLDDFCDMFKYLYSAKTTFFGGGGGGGTFTE